MAEGRGPPGWEPAGLGRPVGRRHFWPGCGGCWGRGRAPASPSDGPGAQGGCPLPHGAGALRGRGVGPGRADPP